MNANTSDHAGPARTGRWFRWDARAAGWVLLVLVAVVSWSAMHAMADDPEILSFENGVLTWSNPSGSNHMFAVEWTHDLTVDAWQSSWEQQVPIVSTQSVLSVPVPQFYRVAQGFDNRAFLGIWMLYHSDGPAYMRIDHPGLVTSVGAFMNGVPVGYYEVEPDGGFVMTLFDREYTIFLDGRRISPVEWEFKVDTEVGEMRKIEKTWGLEGSWRGTIGPYTNVSFTVRHDGFIPTVTNLIDVTSGSVFVDDLLSVAGAFSTGAPPESEWTRVQIRGVLNESGPTRIFGDYTLDWDLGWITAGVDLVRQ